jgi:hypothetical protein
LYLKFVGLNSSSPVTDNRKFSIKRKSADNEEESDSKVFFYRYKYLIVQSNV